MTKIAEPYRCDGPSCGKQRDSDANHWWLIGMWVSDVPTGIAGVSVSTWDAKSADVSGILHACGIDCMTKLVANLAAKLVDANSSTETRSRKEVANGGS